MLQSEIVQSDDCSIRSITALNITNTLGVQDLKMTKTRAQELLEIWCDEGYYLDIDGMLVFGPRMQAEFGQFLKANFPDIVFACSLCKVPIFKVRTYILSIPLILLQNFFSFCFSVKKKIGCQL